MYYLHYTHVPYYMLHCVHNYHCRSTSSEREIEVESSYAMDTVEATMVEDSSDVEFSEDTTADDGKYFNSICDVLACKTCTNVNFLKLILLILLIYHVKISHELCIILHC